MIARLLDSASRDIVDGFDFYERQEVDLGQAFVTTIFAHIENIAASPGIHSRVGQYYRALTRPFPFAIFYKIENETVLVYAVLDCRRSPAWIRKRLP